MDTESINILMDLNMRVIGGKTNSMDMEEKYGQMEPNLKGIILMVKSRVKVLLHGLMEVLIWEIFLRIIYMEEVCIIGLIKEHTMALGK